MFQKMISRIVPAAAIFALGATAAHAQAPAPAAAPAACTAKLAVDSIPSSATPITINAALSAAIGDSASASLPEASAVSVVSVKPAEGQANTLAITLNTGNAKPGEYDLAIKGKSGECSAKIKVTGK